jgi:plastocyanin
MLERLWTSILDLIAQFVTPDWGRIIGLLPVVIIILTVVVLARIFLRLMTAPQARRGKQRLPSKAPSGIHMPGPSWAPVFGAVGMFLLLLGLVFGGVSVILGAIALVLTLLYWLGEGLRLYDRDIGPTKTEMPAVIHEGPPPGVHMPGPSWRPFLAAFGMFALFLGLVFGGWLLAVGIIVLISTLVGWLTDAVNEYRKRVEADTTGHLDNPPTQKTPTRQLAFLMVLLVGAAVLQSGVFAGGSANGGTGGAAASGAPAPGTASGAPSSGAPGSGAPASGAPGANGPAASGATADVQLEARNIAFVEKTFSAPAARPFTIGFANEDAGTAHDVALKDASGAEVWKGDVFPGVATRVYQVPALPAGSYTFLCIVHPTMTGTATLQ